MAQDHSRSVGSGQSPVFATTHWSVVLAAGGDSQSPRASAALEELCRTYWYPLYAFARREGYREEEAKDLTQGFFAHLLSRDDFRRPKKELGKFRAFLLTSFKHYTISEWRKGKAGIRGGQHEIISLDGLEAEERYRREPADPRTPERLYERKWMMEFLTQAERLHCAEYSSEPLLYEQLKELQIRDSQNSSYSEVAERFGLTITALKTRVKRFRDRYQELLRAVIGQTVATGQDVDDELRHLLKLFG